MMDRTAETSDFQLSRFYAQGWAAGTQCTAEQKNGDALELAVALNPDATRAERVRWAQGFTEAVLRRQDRRDRRKPVFAPRPPRRT